ncbi:hypothetical protein ETAA8_54600 [Anatilimnocola aggregata]|uniref:Uncharacterized protein n=1 Tax=Anatilimnocola aggregata TaxID=2528021 RepID=A0A517YJC8_9BACT|nr:hypothetical protein [Anatilimnocola aggregata]QDU30332.1 hypothetical protein ETAA8_54600 [Anatilimnocola aggregata]
MLNTAECLPSTSLTKQFVRSKRAIAIVVSNESGSEPLAADLCFSLRGSLLLASSGQQLADLTWDHEIVFCSVGLITAGNPDSILTSSNSGVIRLSHGTLWQGEIPCCRLQGQQWRWLNPDCRCNEIHLHA